MKKFKFKLEAPLKMREFEEEKVKIEMGKINGVIQEIDDEIATHERDIQIGHKSQENVLVEGAQGTMLKFYPYFFEGKYKRISFLKKEREKQVLLLEEKRKELYVARGKVKVFEKLKENDFKEYKKKYEKDLNEKIEDMVQAWLVNKK